MVGEISMIKKKITMSDGAIYIVGFKEIGSSNEGLECHILEKKLLRYVSVYCYSRLKGLAPDYLSIAIWTITKYREELEQKTKLMNESWG